MIIARAPVRVSFAGGGTDLPAFYERHGGYVVSATINRYVYALASTNDRDSIQVTSSDLRAFSRFDEHYTEDWDEPLRLAHAVLREIGVTRGLDLFVASEVLPGTGLGSSSAATVAIVKALCAHLGIDLSAEHMAQRACTIEIERMGARIGKQDQYAAAFGGLNTFEFHPNDHVTVTPIPMDDDVAEALQRRLLLVYTGRQRDANEILARQSQAVSHAGDRAEQEMLRMLPLAREADQALRSGDLDHLGAVIREGWERKRAVVGGITSPEIDRWIDTALANGALGARIAGAGGGGHLVALAAYGREEELREALKAAGLLPVDIRLDFGGARVLMNSEPFPHRELERQAVRL